jgi:hypothetical protein
MPEVGFEPTIPVLERAKAVHALDRAATVISFFVCDHCSENVQNARLNTCDITSSETHVKVGVNYSTTSTFRTLLRLWKLKGK